MAFYIFFIFIFNSRFFSLKEKLQNLQKIRSMIDEIYTHKKKLFKKKKLQIKLKKKKIMCLIKISKRLKLFCYLFFALFFTTISIAVENHEEMLIEKANISVHAKSDFYAEYFRLKEERKMAKMYLMFFSECYHFCAACKNQDCMIIQFAKEPF